MIKIIMFLLVLPIGIFADHFPAHLENLRDDFISAHCPYFENVASESYWYQWKVDHPGSASLTLSEVKFYGDASGTYNADYVLASNTFAFDGYWGAPRLVKSGGFDTLYLQENPFDPNSPRKAGPTLPDGSPSWVVYIFCPSNSISENNADRYGWGGGCKKNNHRGFQSQTTGKIYMSTGLWESQ